MGSGFFQFGAIAEGVLEHSGTCGFCEPEHVFPWAPLEVELRFEWSQLSEDIMGVLWTLPEMLQFAPAFRECTPWGSETRGLA